MSLSLDKYFSLHENSLRLRAQRTEVLASNIANADTPGYKAKDIDFQAALKSSMGGRGEEHTQLKRTNFNHMGGVADNALDGWIKYRIPHQPALDGNTVESHVEQAAFAKNAVEYQATLQFLGGKSKSLIHAIKGSE